MLSQNYVPKVKVEADQINYGEFYSTRLQLVSEVKIQHQEHLVKIQEEGLNMMIFYTNQDRVKAQDLTDQQEKIKTLKKAPKTKPVKIKTMIIQKDKPINDGSTKKKSKDKRTGKYEQSQAQRFIKRITGYHYCKNFNQFYHKQMSMYMRKKKKVSQSEFRQNQIQEHKDKKMDSMTRSEITQLTEYILASAKAYEPYMKKYKQLILYDLFEGPDFVFFEIFFRNLFKKLYEIMIKVTYRRLFRQMLNMNKNSMQIKDLSYNGLDQFGQVQIAQAFNMVFQRCISEWKSDLEGRKELLRLKLQKLAQMQ